MDLNDFMRKEMHSVHLLDLKDTQFVYKKTLHDILKFSGCLFKHQAIVCKDK